METMKSCARALLALYCLSLAPLGAIAQERAKLRMGVIENSARSISHMGLNIALKRGFMAHQNIDLEIVPLPGVQFQIEELDKGKVDVSHTATPYLIQAVLAGSDTVAVVGGLANPVFSVIGKPGIKSYADLKGKVVGLSLPVDSITLGTLKLFARAGLATDSYEARVLVGTPPRVACLVDVDCAAVPIGQPDDLVLMRKGYEKLGDSLEVIPALQFNVLAARRSWAHAHEDVLVRYVRAIGDAYRYMNDPTNRADVVALIAEATRAPLDIADELYRFYFEPYRGIMPRGGEINMEGMSAVISLMHDGGELKAPLPDASRFVDLSFLRKAGLQ
jgi:ABC-type nitrate/sulfonate/bicarbonate transport system substrate-binding protein